MAGKRMDLVLLGGPLTPQTFFLKMLMVDQEIITNAYDLYMPLYVTAHAKLGKR